MTIKQDSAYIGTRDLFGDLCRNCHEADARMAELGLLIETWLRNNSKFKGRITWVNAFDRDLNPDGTYGFFRFVQEVK